jgi:hypothetical protein
MTTKVWSIDIDGKPFIGPQTGTRQFRCVFDIDVSPGDALSFADIRVYNLNKDTVVKQRSSIVFRAGNSEREGVVFTGFVTNSFRERSPGSPEIPLRLVCKSGQPNIDRGSVQQSFGKNTKVTEVIQVLAAAWPIPLDIDYSHFADDQVLVSGFIVDGDIPAALDDLAYAYGFEWVQELGRLSVTKKNKARSTVIRKVNQFTGMIGIPEVTRGGDGIGVFVSVDLDPSIRVNSRIDIESELSTFNTGNLYLQELTGDANANGEYNVFSLHHRGDTHGDLWSTDIDGIRAGSVSPTIRSIDNGNLVWGAKVDQEFRVKVREIGARLNIDPNWLMAVMGFETGYTFDPSIRNPGSSATGLIQFIESTARGLGTTTAALSRMTAVRQLDYVERYYSNYARRIRSLGDAYMAVLWPAGIGRPDSYIMWERDSGPYQAAYAANSGLDLDNSGSITKGEAVTRVNASYLRGQNFMK